MPALVIVLVFGLMVNPLVNGASNLEEYNKGFVKKFEKPIVKEVPKKYND